VNEEDSERDRATGVEDEFKIAVQEEEEEEEEGLLTNNE